ncbi:MAG: hypothetical protein WBC70_13910 [Candidatus Aminicenantales bacterium]
MKLSARNKKTLIVEIKFALEKMKSEKEPNSILYYFSAVYGVMYRIFNIEYDSDLVFAHFVISSTYNQINSRIQVPDKVIQLPPDLFDKLIKTTEELLDAMVYDKNLYEALKTFTLLGYVTVGNGYYLYQKGLLKI